MSEAFCDLHVATAVLPCCPTLEDIEVLLEELRSHGDASYVTDSCGEEDDEGNWCKSFNFRVIKRFYKGSPEYIAWLREKEDAEVRKRAEQARRLHQQQKVQQDKVKVRDTEYWNYIHRRTDEMQYMEKKYGPCPRWVGYVPTYTAETCGVVCSLLSSQDEL